MSARYDVLAELVLRQESTQSEALAQAERLLYDALTRASDRGADAIIAEAMLAVRELETFTVDIDGLVERVTTSASIHLGVAQAAEMQPVILRALHHAYRHGRRSVPLPEVGGDTWNISDQYAQDWLQRDAMYWVGRFDQATIVDLGGGERTSIGTLVGSEVREGIRLGQSSKQVGERLRGRLGPLRTGVVDSYWRGVAANAATRASTFGACEAFVQADVVTYEIVSVLDERTSNVCQELDGLTFEVRSLVNQRDRMLGAASPDDVRTIQPWPSTKQVTTLKAEGGTAALTGAGIMSPPFHFHCRTTVVVASSGYITTTQAPMPRLPPPRSDPERQAAFVAAFDSRDPALYEGAWKQGKLHDMRMGQLVQGGYAEGTEYWEPWMQGLKLSPWPTVPVPMDRRRYWWRPEPSPSGGVWVSMRDDASPPSGAIISSDFAQWLSRREAA